MTRNDIDRLFTEKVTHLMARGYQIHTASMDGTQGEVAHIDLTNGSEILRVLLSRDYLLHGFCGDYLILTVGRDTDHGSIIWNNHLDILFQIKLAKVGKDYFVPEEEAPSIQRKRTERWEQKCPSPAFKERGDAYKLVALRWMKRQFGMKTYRLSDITRMTRETFGDGTYSYDITAKGKMLRLGNCNH